MTRGSKLIFPVLVIGFMIYSLLKPSRSFQQPMELSWLIVGIAVGFFIFRWVWFRRRPRKGD
ncbi:MAG TPA: hypothetical protein VGL40_00895 [Bacillota bacterium]